MSDRVLKKQRTRSTLDEHPMSEWWHPLKNGKKRPSDVARGSGKLFWFRHDTCGHDFQKSPSKIRKDEPSCPYCVPNSSLFCGARDCLSCFNKSYASLKIESPTWHPTKNGPLEPWLVKKKSEKFCWFFHDRCGHSFESRICEVVAGSSYCPFCSNSRLCGMESCDMCRERSLFSADLLGLTWVVEKNAPLTLLDVAKQSNIWFWFTHDCGHVFQAMPYSIVGQKCGCPFCAEFNSRLCGKLDCQVCFSRSIASVELSALSWHPTKNLPTIRENVHKVSNLAFWFVCNFCSHDVQVQICGAANAKKCKHCSDSKWVHCGDKTCSICVPRSIVMQEQYQYLSSKNDENVWMLALHSEVSVIYDCPLCKHEYVARVASVTLGTWCKCKKNKTEAKVFSAIKEMFPTRDVQKSLYVDWCRNPLTGKCLPFDICIDDKIFIEVDGEQHFMEKKMFSASSLESRKARDIEKMRFALKNGRRIIRIFQIDAWHDKLDWRAELKALVNSDVLKFSFVPTKNETVKAVYEEQRVAIADLL